MTIPFATFAAVALLPIVNPPKVTRNADSLIEAPDVVMIKVEAEVLLQMAVRPATLLAPDATAGMTDERKKLKGYVRVMMPPEGTKLLGVNPKVMRTDDFPATRSERLMVKDTDLTWLGSIAPDETANDASGSDEV
jgi:hypothetical protein